MLIRFAPQKQIGDSHTIQSLIRPNFLHTAELTNLSMLASFLHIEAEFDWTLDLKRLHHSLHPSEQGETVLIAL